MAEPKDPKPDTWTVRQIHDLIRNGEIEKQKYQRPKKWLDTPNQDDNKPSIRKYIDFLYEIKSSVSNIMMGKRNNIYSNIDGNNRLNALVYYLEYPFKIYPEHKKEITEFIINTYPAYITDELTIIFLKLTYNELIDFSYRDYFIEIGKTELYESQLKIKRDEFEDFYYGNKSKNITGFLSNFKVRSKHNFNDTVKINVNIFEDYSCDELNDIYLRLNKYNSAFTEIEILASQLYDVSDFTITDRIIYQHITNHIINIYEKRSEGEVLNCFKYDETCIMNAYDFLIGFQNYINDEYKYIEKATTKGLPLFFKLWKKLYKGLDNTFSTTNVNDFITKITKALNILHEVSDNIFPKHLTSVSKRSVTKFNGIRTNGFFLIFMSIFGYLNEEGTCDKIIIKSIEKCLLYHMFLERILDTQQKASFKVYDQLTNKGGAGVIIDNLGDKMYVKPSLISVSITRQLMEQLIEQLIAENTHNKPYDNEICNRKNRPYFEECLILNYFKLKIPCEFLEKKYWSEHIIPFSSSFDHELDIDRFGNTIPIIDTINNKRRCKHIEEYAVIEQTLNIDFVKFLGDIMPTHESYDKIVSHDKSKPNIINTDEFNNFCIQNEKQYVDTFLNSLFQM